MLIRVLAVGADAPGMPDERPSPQPAYPYLADPPGPGASPPAARQPAEPPSPAPGAVLVRAVALASLVGNVLIAVAGAVLAAADVVAGRGDPDWHALGAGLGITLGVVPGGLGLALITTGLVHLRRTGRAGLLAGLTVPASVVPALAAFAVLVALVTP